MQTSHILVGELQLGQTLNHCVRDGKKSEFDLLLAMLSDDVCQQDQFAIENTDTLTPLEHSLNEQFNVPKPQAMQATTLVEEVYSLKMGQVALDQGLIAARLQHCLCPEALHFQSDRRHGIASDVYDSLSPSAAQRFNAQKNNIVTPDFNMDELIFSQQHYQAELHTA